MSVSKSDFVAQLLGFIAGINKHYAGATLQLDSQSVAATSLVTLFQTAVDADALVAPADTARTAAIEKATVALQAARPMAKAFKSMVLTASGKDTATLADFKLTPPKTPVVSPEARVAAAKKSAATRKALGTMGAQQKKAAKKALAAQATPPADAPAPAAATPAVPAPPKA
ncbi:MAG TPA: hypothetical protein VGL81_05265 [Polyangiaceae bacterium]|jgi:hypothetical protein